MLETSRLDGENYEADDVSPSTAPDSTMSEYAWAREQLLQGKPVHFPQEIDREGRQLDPDWLYAAIEAEKRIDVQNAVFTRPIRLKDLRIVQPLIVSNSECEGMDFSFAHFEALVRLENVTVEKVLDLNASHFSKDLSLSASRFGRVILNGTTVDLSLEAARCSFLGEVQAESLTVGRRLFLREAIFDGPAFFYSAEVGTVAYFYGAHFGGDERNPAHFDGMRVGNKLNIQHSVFHGEARFGVMVGTQLQAEHALFEAGANFDSLEVNEGIFFDDAIIRGNVALREATVGGQANFNRVRFLDDTGSEARFDGMHVKRSMFFIGTTFGLPSYFNSAVVQGQGGWLDTVFEKEAKFQSARIGQAIFRRVGFCAGADFLFAELGGLADFRESRFQQKWDLRWAKIGTLRIDDELGANPKEGSDNRFEGVVVDLRGCTYERIQAFWQPLLDRLPEFDRQPYSELEMTLRRQGRDDLADSVYMRRRGLQAAASPWWSPWRWVQAFLGAMTGYGARRGRGILTLIILPVFIIFLLLRVGRLWCPELQAISLGESFLLALQSYLPTSIPAKPGLEGNLCSYTLWVSTIARVTGWLLLPVAVAVLTGLMRYVGRQE